MHTTETLSKHPFVDPAFFARKAERADAQRTNRELALLERTMKKPMRRVAVPKLGNRYLPHTGVKQYLKGRGISAANIKASGARLVMADPAADMELVHLAHKEVEALLADLPQFNIADEVRWTSSGKQKVGTVKAILRAGELPGDANCRVKDATSPRDHVSFVVAVGKTLYWPRVSLLERV